MSWVWGAVAALAAVVIAAVELLSPIDEAIRAARRAGIVGHRAE